MYKLIVFFLSCQLASADQCYFDAVHDFPNSPLIAVEKNLLKPPSKQGNEPIGRKLLLEKDNEFEIICPEKTTTATCEVGSTIKIGPFSTDFINEKCANVWSDMDFKVVKPAVKSEYCEQLPGHELYNVKFDSTSDAVYVVCFDTRNLRPFYTKHILTKWIMTDTHYSQDNFLVNIKDKGNLYSSTSQSVAQLYAQVKPKWLPGNLASSGDFFYPQESLTTFDFINTAVQHDNIAKGNWAQLEKVLRFLTSYDIHDKLIIYTGTLNDLRDNNNNVLYLDQASQKIPYPQWFWKIVYSSAPEKGIVFFIYNDVVDEPRVTSAFGTLCNQYKPPLKIYSVLPWVYGIIHDNKNKGIFYACSFKDIQNPDIKEILKTITNNWNRVDNL